MARRSKLGLPILPHLVLSTSGPRGAETMVWPRLGALLSGSWLVWVAVAYLAAAIFMITHS